MGQFGTSSEIHTPHDAYADRQAKQTRYNTLLVLTFVTLPLALLGVLLMLVGMGMGSPGLITLSLVMMGTPAMFFGISRLERSPKTQFGKCYHCGHNLSGGGMTDTCPECGEQLAFHVGPRFIGESDTLCRSLIEAMRRGDTRFLLDKNLPTDQVEAAISALRDAPEEAGHLERVSSTPGPQSHLCHYVERHVPGGQVYYRIWVGEQEGEPAVKAIQVIASPAGQSRAA
jgi:hypothetical protein